MKGTEGLFQLGDLIFGGRASGVGARLWMSEVC